jgi:enoyl-CoA hydratase/carnithine racemase
MQAVGVAAAKELILLAKRLNAVSAQEYGLVHRIVEPDCLDSEVEKLAAKLLRVPVHTLGVSKRIINQGQGITPAQSQQLEIEGMVELIHDIVVKEELIKYLDTYSHT